MKSASLWMITDTGLCQSIETPDSPEAVLLKYCQKYWHQLDALIVRELHWTKAMVADFIERLPKNSLNNPRVLLNWPQTYEPWDLPISGIHLSGKAAQPYLKNERQRQFLKENLKAKGWALGVSVHSFEAWDALKVLEPSYVLISNVYETSCKPGKNGLGFEGTQQLVDYVRCTHPHVDCIGLGGLKCTDEAQVTQMGLNGMALRSEFHKD